MTSGVWVNDYKKRSQSTESYNRASLQALVSLIKQADALSRTLCKDCTFISASDTIVIFSPCDKTEIANYEMLNKANIGRANYWSDAKIVEYSDIPIKRGFWGIKYCVDWGSEAEILNKIFGKHHCAIPRYCHQINANKYLYALRSKEETSGENK